MLTIKTGWNASQTQVLVDGEDVTEKLAIKSIEVEPILAGGVVRVRLTVLPDLLEVEALPDWVQLKLSEAEDEEG